MYFSRGLNKVQDVEGIRDIYKYYKEKHEGMYSIEYDTFREILHEYYKEIMKDILLHGYELKLPYRFGSLHIVKSKVKVNKLTRFGIDWVETVKNKKVIYHLNTHSKGFTPRFKWEKRNTLIPNLFYYKFVASRANKRELARVIKNKQADYFE